MFKYGVHVRLVLLVLHLSTVHKWCSMTASTPRLHSPTPRQVRLRWSPTLFSIFLKLGCLETPHSFLRGHTTETAGA